MGGWGERGEVWLHVFFLVKPEECKKMRPVVEERIAALQR